MRQTTLCFLVKDDQVLLAIKKRGFGVGKWNGAGGKVKDNESIGIAAARELNEEVGVKVSPSDLELVGTLQFDFDGNPDWAQRCEVFIARHWEGEPSESEEMRPRWYAIDKLPFEGMWIDDPHWVPLVLSGKKISGKFLFNKDGSAILNFEVFEVHP
ncbi:MAG: 8-oxo-dGTP diphosphatase [Candidatus Pacebacteria bacterium]|nr:8-oxo-dGTP diphosphatase [Candidatus Paceibacterota bacterium]